MKSRGLLFLLLLFILMVILNVMTPLLADDYFSAFVYPEGLRINGNLPENAKKLNAISDFIESTKAYYLTWGGRVPGGIPAGIFVWQGKGYFNPLNAFMMIMLVAEIYWISHEGKLSFDFDPMYLFGIFFSLWSFNVSYIDTCLWLAGSSNYLWMVVVVLAFLIPYVRNYFDKEVYKNCKNYLILPMFFLGLLAGWSHETTTCWIILILTYWMYLSRKNGDLSGWKLSGYIGFCLGYALLIFAPGNFSRLQMQQNTTSVIIASELLQAKLVELVIILFFHFIIWYFIISFYFKYNRHRQKGRFRLKETALYINISKAFILVACGSGLLMFFIPSNGFRPSFLNLVYLTIALAFLFRIQERNGVSFVHPNAKTFLSVIGCIYLVFTLSISLWGNFINWNYWNEILVQVKEIGKKSPNVIMEIHPYPTSSSEFWLFGSGFHLVPIPISNDETQDFNRMFSKYYGIMGIKVKEAKP